MSMPSILYTSRSAFITGVITDIQLGNTASVSAAEPCFSQPGFFNCSESEDALKEWIARQQFSCLLLAPLADESHSNLDDVSCITDILAECFALIKAAVTVFEARGIVGRVIVLLPVDAVMGDCTSSVSAAVGGALLSLIRTVALELKKTSCTANAVMYSPVPGVAANCSAASIAALVESLADPRASAVNGQEIYAASAVDVGRLHP